ncbi:MAG TPA: DNA-directed RNA polymerase subunit beta [Lentibacillus sp.]|uniref:DNA-directed RNA polymerase subunit beta n=1 Tax=Lentibacillus sp. TaxID=1925746 RepID=UPI002B4B2C04|nr:DNA-directed RNA polymerase subunit beta [Lentibacillus sp.]HLR61499.1 DNA-directed RNA polymerase subunit beta [Lentibacillus sp.]
MPTDVKEKNGQRNKAAEQEKEQQREKTPGKVTRKKQKQHQETATDEATRKEQKKKRRQEKRQNKKPRRRIFPIWQRIIVVLVLSAIALIVGVMVGYGVIGDGNPIDALKWETWQHIIDIVVKEE